MISKALSFVKNKHFLSLSGNGIMKVLAVVSMGILYRVLSKEEMGVWVFFQATFLLIDTFRSGFITTAFIKFYAGSSEERMKEIAGSTWHISFRITGILVLANIPFLFFLNFIDNPGLRLFFEWFGLTFILTLPSFVAQCVLQGDQRFDRLLYIRAVNQVSFIILVLVMVLFLKVNLLGVVFCNLAASLITSIYALAKGWSRISNFAQRTKTGIKEIFDFGKYSVGTTLSSNLFGVSDTYIINFFLGPASVAIYNLGQSLLQIIEVPLVSFVATGMPALSMAYNQNKRGEVIYTLKKYTGMLTVILVPISLLAVILADIPIYIIGGGKYMGTEAANVFRLFLTFALLYPADRFFALTLDVIHRPKVNFYKVLVMLAANITFDLSGVYLFGNIYGVALATVVPTLIGVYIGHRELQKYQPFTFFSVFSMGYSETMEIVNGALQRYKKNKKPLP